jgi:NAD(P)-dependent dehydrogenase (short-subunit alcohol dehydrogenase family)
VTGSGQGIGEATAHLFAAEGAKVVVTDLDKGNAPFKLLIRLFIIYYIFIFFYWTAPFAAKSDKVAADIKAKGGEAISVAGDVTDPKFPEHIIKATIDAFGRSVTHDTRHDTRHATRDTTHDTRHTTHDTRHTTRHTRHSRSVASAGSTFWSTTPATRGTASPTG